MGNLRINIRFLWYHLQVTHGWKFSISSNDYHRKLEHGWFKIHQFEPFKKFNY